VYEASLLLLNKMDLMPYVPFDLEKFRTDVARLNPNVTLLEMSVTAANGADAWLRWLTDRVVAAKAGRNSYATT